MGLTSHLNLSDKLMVMESTFDRKFLSNSFFKGLAHEAQFELLKCCTPKTVMAGEYVYSHNQSSDKIFLIISGRVSCLLSGGVCFKTYVEGSYFGDLDSLNHMRRLFTVRAEEPLKLAVLDRDQLEQVLSSDPSNRLVVREKTLKRYISFTHSISKIKHFMHIGMAHDFWEEETQSLGADSVNWKVHKWLAEVAQYRKNKNKMKHSSSLTPKVRTLVLHGKSKHKISLLPEMIKLTDKIRESHEGGEGSRHLINRNRPRRQTRKLMEGSLTTMEKVFYYFKKISDSIEQLSYATNILYSNQVKLAFERKVPITSMNQLFSNQNLKCPVCKTDGSHLRRQLIELIEASKTELSKNEILQRLNEIVYPERESLYDTLESTNFRESLDVLHKNQNRFEKGRMKTKFGKIHLLKKKNGSDNKTPVGSRKISFSLQGIENAKSANPDSRTQKPVTSVAILSTAKNNFNGAGSSQSQISKGFIQRAKDFFRRNKPQRPASPQHLDNLEQVSIEPQVQEALRLREQEYKFILQSKFHKQSLMVSHLNRGEPSSMNHLSENSWKSSVIADINNNHRKDAAHRPHVETLQFDNPPSRPAKV